MSETTDRARLVRVSFRKMVSDGNYGTETAEASLDWYVSDQETDAHQDQEDAEEMLRQCRQLVHNELARSPSQRVRMLFQVPPQLAPALVGPHERDAD